MMTDDGSLCRFPAPEQAELHIIDLTTGAATLAVTLSSECRVLRIEFGPDRKLYGAGPRSFLHVASHTDKHCYRHF